MSCNNMQDAPDAKKPRSILKQSSSFDKHSISSGISSHRKSAKFDELNVLQTYHPPDKDYGHMKIEEPKTPYNYTENQELDQLDAELLTEKLNVAAANARLSISSEDSSEEGEQETDDQKDKRVEFEKRRKLHYNEFEAVKLARKLIEEEDDDVIEDDCKKGENIEKNINVDNQMEVEEKEYEQPTSTKHFQ